LKVRAEWTVSMERDPMTEEDFLEETGPRAVTR
jgi:hypothetical protein